MGDKGEGMGDRGEGIGDRGEGMGDRGEGMGVAAVRTRPQWYALYPVTYSGVRMRWTEEGPSSGHTGALDEWPRVVSCTWAVFLGQPLPVAGAVHLLRDELQVVAAQDLKQTQSVPVFKLPLEAKQQPPERRTHIHARTHTHTHTYTHTHTRTHTHTHTHRRTLTNVHTHTYTHSQMYTHRRPHIQKHTHTHTQR